MYFLFVASPLVIGICLESGALALELVSDLGLRTWFIRPWRTGFPRRPAPSSAASRRPATTIRRPARPPRPRRNRRVWLIPWATPRTKKGYRPGGPGRLPAQGSHRSGRTDFPVRLRRSSSSRYLASRAARRRLAATWLHTAAGPIPPKVSSTSPKQLTRPRDKAYSTYGCNCTKFQISSSPSGPAAESSAGQSERVSFDVLFAARNTR